MGRDGTGSQKPGRSAAARRKEIALVALLGIVTWLCFLPVLNANFVYDDHALILDNPLVTEKGIAAWRLFGQPFPWEGNSFHFYRPLTILCYRLNALASAPDASWFHAVNLAIHILVAALFFLFCRKLFREEMPALFAALLFALTPAHAEAVCWLSARGDLLIGLAAVVLLHLLEEDRPPAGQRSWLILLTFALSLLIKESAAVFIPLAAALILAREPDGPGTPGRWRKPFTLLLAMLAVFAAYWIVRSLVIGQFLKTINEIEGLTISQRLALTGRMLWQGFSNLVCLPHPTVEYHWPDGVRLGWQAVCGWLALGLVGISWLLLKNRNLRTGMALLAWGFLPYAHIVYSCEAFGERYSYVPSLGFCIVIAEALRLLRRRAAHRLLAGLALIWILSMGLQTHNYARVWKDDATLWDHALRLSPASPRALRNYGTSRLNRGEWREALAAFRRLQDTAGNDLPGRILRLRALGQGRMFTEGVQLARVSLGIYPNSAELHFLYGRLLLRSGAENLARREVEILRILSAARPKNRIFLEQLQAEFDSVRSRAGEQE